MPLRHNSSRYIFHTIENFQPLTSRSHLWSLVFPSLQPAMWYSSQLRDYPNNALFFRCA